VKLAIYLQLSRKLRKNGDMCLLSLHRGDESLLYIEKEKVTGKLIGKVTFLVFMFYSMSV